METDKFKNGPQFEEGLVQALLSDHQFAEQMMEVLEVDYFTLTHLQSITRCLREYYDKYRVFPSTELLASIVTQDEHTNAGATLLTEYFRNIQAKPLNGDAQYIMDQGLEFCRKQKLLLAIERCLEMTETKNFSSIVREISEAAALGAERDFGHVWEDKLEERMTEAQRKPVATPWPSVNELTSGGVSAGELNVLLALTGVGKSHGLVDLGAHAALNGLNVTHLTFELSEIKTGKRYDARIANVAYDELKYYRDTVKNCIDGLKGRIRIKSYPNRKATVQTIRAYLSKLKTEGFYTDLLVIDYADIMKSSRAYENKRFEEEAVYEELRSLADELQIPIWTAAQTNRSGMDAEVLTLKHIAECFNKAMVADLFITMNRKKTGADQTIGNLFIAKNRNGTDGKQFHAVFDTSRSKITVLQPGSDEEHVTLFNFDKDVNPEDNMTLEERVKVKHAKKRAQKEMEDEQFGQSEACSAEVS